MEKKEYLTPRSIVIEISDEYCLVPESATSTGYRIEYEDEEIEIVEDSFWDR